MNDTTILYPAKKDGKSGYINSKGEVVIDFSFDFFGSREFTDGLASVLVNDKAGYINKHGNFIIEPKFDLAMPFSEGLAYVKLNNKYGYIDKTGQFVIEPQFYSCDSFNEEFALVKDNIASKGFFIDKNGVTKLQGRNFLISKLRDGLINCPNDKGNWGYINIENEVIIDFKFKYTRPFYEGKGAVAPQKDLEGKSNRKDKFGFINIHNELIIEPVFQGADMRFSDGICTVWDEAYGCIDENGKLIIPYEFDFIKHFNEGLAVFNPKGRNKKYGFINKTGIVKIEPKYTHLDDFKNGLAKVTVGTEFENFKYGYINQNGEEIWEPRR